MAKDDYALVNTDEFNNLKGELDALKQSPLLNTKSGTQLQGSISDLNSSLGQMLDIFKKASDEMTLEEKEERMIGKQIKPLFAKVDQLLEQNETIADGIVTVADKVDALQKRIEQLEQQPMHEPMHDPLPNQPHFDQPPMDFGAPDMNPAPMGQPDMSPPPMGSQLPPMPPPGAPDNGLPPLGAPGMPPPSMPPDMNMQPNGLEKPKKKFGFFKK